MQFCCPLTIDDKNPELIFPIPESIPEYAVVEQLLIPPPIKLAYPVAWLPHPPARAE